MRLCSFLLPCLAAALSSAFVISPPHMWTKLILTHHWPSTFCSMEHPVCHPNISYWTLHGLWPDKGIDCNSSWHFNSSQIEVFHKCFLVLEDVSQLTLPSTDQSWREYLADVILPSYCACATPNKDSIEDLLPDMKTSWPDLLNPLSASFWKYEWHKHGTCAAKAPSLNSQHKYFSKALELYHKVDLDSILKKFDITPSEKYYKLSQIEGVIENFYSVKPKIQCVHPSKNADFQILGQIEICFNPDFTLLDCEKQFTMETTSKGDWDNPVAVNKASGFSVCDHDMPVYYPPLP